MEGLVGFLIMILIINIGGRLLKSLASGQKQPPKGPRVDVPTRPAPEGGMRPHAVSPAESARIARETSSPREAQSAETAPASSEAGSWTEDRFERTAEGHDESFTKWDEELFERRKIESEGELPEWTEDSFEKIAEMFGYKPESTGKAKSHERKRKAPRISKPAEELSERPAAVVPPVPLPTAGTRRDDTLLHLAGLDSADNLRRTIVLATILGPCKARRRMPGRRRLIE